MQITAQANRWPEFAWNVPEMLPMQIDAPYYALSKKDQSIAYSCAAGGYKAYIPNPPESKRVIQLIITRMDARPEYESPGIVCKLFGAWLIPGKYSQAKHSRLIGEWKVSYASFIFQDVEKEITMYVHRALRR